MRQNQNILQLGPTGLGKSWLGCALAQKACRDGFSVLHKRTTELFRELAVAHVDGSIGRLLLKLSRIDVLVLDDFAMAPLKDGELYGPQSDLLRSDNQLRAARAVAAAQTRGEQKPRRNRQQAVAAHPRYGING